MWCTNSVQVELLCGLWNYKSFIGVLLTIQLMINALQIVDGVEVAKQSNALKNCDNETLYTVRFNLNDECKFS